MNDNFESCDHAKSAAIDENSMGTMADGGEMNMLDREGALPDADRVNLSDILQVGSKVVIGGGLGLLGGIAVVAVAASAAEIVIAGTVSKIAGAVGGAVGLSRGLKDLNGKNGKRR